MKGLLAGGQNKSVTNKKIMSGKYNSNHVGKRPKGMRAQKGQRKVMTQEGALVTEDVELKEAMMARGIQKAR